MTTGLALTRPDPNAVTPMRLNAVRLAIARSEWPKAQELMNALATTGNIPPTLATTLAHDQAVIDFMQGRDAQALAALQPLAKPGSGLAPATF